MEHTEKVIEEMLENLLQSDDEDYTESLNEAPNVVEADNSDELNAADNSDCIHDVVEQINGDNENDFEQLESTKPSSAHNLTIAEELRKMREEYPLSADSEETLTTPSTVALKTASIASGGGGDISPRTSSSKISYDNVQGSYRNEVSRVLFAGKTENCPAENTPEYFAAAQEYAVFGNDFMDFPPDFEQVYSQVRKSAATKQANSEKLQAVASTIMETTNQTADEEPSAVSKTPKARFDITNGVAGGNFNTNDVHASEQCEQTVFSSINGSKNNSNAGFHSFQPRAPALAAQQQKALSAAATAGAATAATYYQLCSNLQRPGSASATTAQSFNTTANVGHSTSVPYQPPGFQHQQLPATTNLNQTAFNVAASNVRFASNASLLSHGTTTSATSAVNVGTVNVYERMVYAQLLQQQLIKTRQQQLQQQQQQQAIAAATIFQQQLQRQQQLKMAAAAAAIQHVTLITNNSAATSGVDLTANVNMQRTSPNSPQVVNFSATLSSSQSRINSTNKPTNFNSGNFNNTREGNNGPN